MYLNKRLDKLEREGAGLTVTLDVFKWMLRFARKNIWYWLTVTLDVFKCYSGWGCTYYKS